MNNPLVDTPLTGKQAVERGRLAGARRPENRHMGVLRTVIAVQRIERERRAAAIKKVNPGLPVPLSRPNVGGEQVRQMLDKGQAGIRMVLIPGRVKAHRHGAPVPIQRRNLVFAPVGCKPAFSNTAFSSRWFWNCRSGRSGAVSKNVMLP